MKFNKIITFGLSGEQNETVKRSLPLKDYELLITEGYTDIIAIGCSAVVINANNLNDEEYEVLMSYYTEVKEGLYETVFWIGNPKPYRELMKVLKCYESFEQFELNIKYHFLDAHKRCKRTKAFSEKIADCLRILAEIRKKPRIKTKELATKIERSERTVQRYLTDLQAAETFLEYDYIAKGWYLSDGMSELFGDIYTDNQGGNI